MKRTITLICIMLLSQIGIGQITGTNEDPIIKTRRGSKSELQKYQANAKKRQISKVDPKLSQQNHKTISGSKTLDSLLITEWDDELNAWENGIKEKFSYDENNALSETLLYIWSTSMMEWQVFQKEDYTFDSNGYLIERIRSYQFIPGEWNQSEKVEFSYDTNGNETLETSYFWDLMANSWVPAYKNETTYDGNQNIILYQGFEWFLGINQWQNAFKDEYFYNGGILTSEISSNWNYVMSQWDFASQWLYSYILNQLTTEIQQTWDSNSNTWKNESKFDYAYNANTYLASEIASLWDSGSSTWEFLYKDEYSYGANNNISEGIYYEWEDSPGIWEPYYKDEFVYDLNFTFAELILPYFYGDDFDEAILSLNNMLIGYIGYEFETDLWQVTDRVLFFYSDYLNPLHVTNFELSASIMVYPNPTSELVGIDADIPIDKVEIYSVLGHKVKEVTTDFNAIPVFDMANGLYILKIKSDGKTVSRRLIKR